MHKIKLIAGLLCLTCFVSNHIFSQDIPENLRQQYKAAKSEKERLEKLFSYINGINRDTLFLKKTTSLLDYILSQGDQKGADIVQMAINDELAKTGDYVTALASSLEIVNRFEKASDIRALQFAYMQLSTVYYYAGDKGNDVIYAKKALEIALTRNDTLNLSTIANNISTAYAQSNNADSALRYARMAIHYAKLKGEGVWLTEIWGTLAEAFIAHKQYDSALVYARMGLQHEEKMYDLMKAWTYNDLAQIFLEIKLYDSANYYAHKAAMISAKKYRDQLHRAFTYLSRSFDFVNRTDSAFFYLQQAVIVNDSLNNHDKAKQVRGIIERDQARTQQLENAKIASNNRIKFYSLIGGIAILSVVAFILLRNNRQKRRANTVLENTLSRLQATQAQLVQSEKMASLGELTAGIAHEIQNPLNFVNNFSEVNKELIAEMNDEIAKGNLDEVRHIAKDITENEEKINHHGRRADAIVKGMLQHSRNSSGRKELTDINALCDEFLRLSYHGLRAKDKTFNATLKSDFDPGIGTMSILPQDIGRVVLNLLNNAFYAVSQKKGEAGQGYEPTVTISTKRKSATVEIWVADNGNGIPADISDKIFQPFFTTKPTGQGTGLGLSLSYDIITKGHGGDLRVESTPGAGSVFIITLPVN